MIVYLLYSETTSQEANLRFLSHLADIQVVSDVIVSFLKNHSVSSNYFPFLVLLFIDFRFSLYLFVIADPFITNASLQSLQNRFSVHFLLFQLSQCDPKALFLNLSTFISLYSVILIELVLLQPYFFFQSYSLFSFPFF